jgi:hypothetical protein
MLGLDRVIQDQAFVCPEGTAVRKSLTAAVGVVVALIAFSAQAQIRITGPGNEVLVFEEVSFGPGTGAGLTRIFGTVTNETGDYLSHAAIRVQFFDAASRVYPRPSITCKFTITDLVPGKSSEIGEKNLREIQEHGPTRAGLILKRKPLDCNAVLQTLKISRFSLDIISALRGKHVLAWVKPVSRLSTETGGDIPWDILREETEVEVLEYVPGRNDPYRVRVLEDGRVGYVEADKIVVTPQVEALKQTALESARAVPQSQYGEREVLLRGKYGPEIAARIMNGKIWTGMTREMALESLGKPERMERTLLLEVVHEHWVYRSGLNLYFNNGVLTSYRIE